jgi:hypothetical protein
VSMRILGRRTAKLLEHASDRAEPLHDVEIVADASTLRRLASFLTQAASEMEEKGPRFEHVHLLDAWSAHGSGFPDIVVSRE